MELKENERVKPIKITDNSTGREYLLDFNRDTVSMAENAGFNWDDYPNKLATFTPLIWFISFKRHDRRISKAETDKIIEQMGGLTPEIITRLRELYMQALAPLVADEDEEGNAKNSKWTVSLDM